MKISDFPMFTTEAIHARIQELADEMRTELAESSPLILTVLEGARPFSETLMAKLNLDCDQGNLRAQSYAGTESTGRVVITVETATSLEGRHIVLLEDIVDTGRTANAITEFLLDYNPASVRMAALLDKPVRREESYSPAWTGYTIEDHFVIGFGMDYNGDFRDLPDIRILEP